FADFFYQSIKGVSMGLNSIFGTKIAQSNPNRPFSPLGGDFWFQLGLSHYYRFDRDNEDNESQSPRSRARELRVSDVVAQRGFIKNASGVERGTEVVDY